MTVALLFPGQGGPPPWFALELVKHSPETAALVEQACDHTKTDLLKLLRRGGRSLSDTRVVQPLLAATSLGIHRELELRGLPFQAVAGHSLGELMACAAAGALAPTETVELAAARGAAMACAAKDEPGGMLSVNATSESQVQGELESRRHLGEAWLAAHNAPDEWVVSGDMAVLRSLAEELPGTMLNVSGAWHCPKMTHAAREFSGALAKLTLTKPGKTIVSNQRGEQTVDENRLPQLLLAQLTHPMQWVRSMGTLNRLGVRDFVTVGAGKVLRGLVRKCLGANARIHRAETGRDIDDLMAVVG